jgi:hypothetical protein
MDVKLNGLHRRQSTPTTGTEVSEYAIPYRKMYEFRFIKINLQSERRAGGTAKSVHGLRFCLDVVNNTNVSNKSCCCTTACTLVARCGVVVFVVPSIR